MTKEICWNITARCNQNCKYCHRFLNINELTLDQNKLILQNLIDSGVTDITWTGGEALILDGIDELLEIAFNHGIKNKLITNGKILDEKRIDKIIPFLDSLTLSLDALSVERNIAYGRGADHAHNINHILEYIKTKSYNVKVRINTVLNKLNLDDFPSLIDYLNLFNIYNWRLFKFMPLRETSVTNKNLFEISVEEFQKQVNLALNKSLIKNIDSRVETDMEKKYVLILADGSIVYTEKGIDKRVGNALTDSVRKYL